MTGTTTQYLSPITFECFYKLHKERWLKLAETDVKLAIETAAEEAWDMSRREDVHVFMEGWGEP